MSSPQHISELVEQGPFAGAGPHIVRTNFAMPTDQRSANVILFVIKDATTKNVYYTASVRVVKTDNTTVVGSTPLEWPGIAGGWSGNVSAVPSIDAGELVLSLSIPAGYTIEISFRVDGLTT